MISVVASHQAAAEQRGKNLAKVKTLERDSESSQQYRAEKDDSVSLSKRQSICKKNTIIVSGLNIAFQMWNQQNQNRQNVESRG
jgi:hypothetical protein